MYAYTQRNLPLLLSTFPRCPPYHPHLHHHHPHPQAGQTQPLFANTPATTCMLLDTHHCHSEVKENGKKDKLGEEKKNYTVRSCFKDSENIRNVLLALYPLPCRKIWHF